MLSRRGFRLLRWSAPAPTIVIARRHPALVRPTCLGTASFAPLSSSSSAASEPFVDFRDDDAPSSSRPVDVAAPGSSGSVRAAPPPAPHPFASGLPGDRLPSLRRALESRLPLSLGCTRPRPLRILETHSGLTGLIAERVACPDTGRSYDGMWSSSLTASAARAMPDIEAVDVSARLDTVRETLAVTTKPLIFDADTGGEPEVFAFTVRALEQLGVSAAVIEDKSGLKRNSLFGTDRVQTLATVEDFAARIRAGVDARRHPDFMVVARMESLIAGAGMDEALRRAVASTDAGADMILIHSKSKSSAEVGDFAGLYREFMGDSTAALPIVAVPSTYSSSTERELAEAGIDVCIYANQMLRAAYPAMVRAAGSILAHSRSHEAENSGALLPVKEIIRLIDDQEGGAGTEDMASLAFGRTGREQNAADEHAGPNGANGHSPAASSEVAVNGTAAMRASPLVMSAAVPCAKSAVASAVRGESTVAAALLDDSEDGFDIDAAASAEEEKVSAGVDPSNLLEYLRSDLGVSFFVGVPDSCLKHFCSHIDDAVDDDENDATQAEKARHVVAANEGASVGLALGHHLATGGVPLVYMQNSGLGNAVNPLLSAAHPEVYGVPMVLLVGWRGYPDADGGKPDEPQHRVAGRETVDLLRASGVEAVVLPDDDGGAKRTMEEAFREARERCGPVAVLVRPDTFKKKGEAVASIASASASRQEEEDVLLPTREETISAVLDHIGPADVIVSTTGFTSRELYELREVRGESHSSDFLCVGSMGHAASIAQGLALERPDRTVWCLDGDGAALMHLGSLVSGPALGLSNLRHVLINNSVHESVGGQPTSVSQMREEEDAQFDFADLARVAGYASSEVVRSTRALSTELERTRLSSEPAFVEVKVRTGTREGLGRPKHSTLDAKEKFRAFVDAVPPAEEVGDASVGGRKKRLALPDGGLLLTPGPLTTSERTKRAMLRDWGSRDRRFVDLTAKVRRDLIDIFPAGETDNADDGNNLTAILLQGSGTYAVEAMIAQFVPKDKGRLAVLSNGAYGRRMASICEANGIRYVIRESPENIPLDPAEVDSFLRSDPGAKGATHVAVVHCETTTGVLNPLPDIARAVERSGRKLLVDAMSSFGVVEVDPRTVAFEALAASSNKCLQGPPGLGFVVCDTTALERSAGNAATLSLDLYEQWRSFEDKGEWRFTPPTHVMLGFSHAIDEFKDEGMTRGRAVRYDANRDVLVEGMRKLGFETLIDDEHRAPVIVTFLVPADANFKFGTFYNILSEKGFVIYPGKVATTSTFRVGCIGDIYPDDMRRFLEAVEGTMDEMDVRSGRP